MLGKFTTSGKSSFEGRHLRERANVGTKTVWEVALLRRKLKTKSASGEEAGYSNRKRREKDNGFTSEPRVTVPESAKFKRG